MQDTRIDTKVTPYTVMNYNMLLMQRINEVFLTMNYGGTGFEQADNLFRCLKPDYQDDMKRFKMEIDLKFNRRIADLEEIIRKSPLQSTRIYWGKELHKTKQEYARLLVQDVIRVLDKIGALEFKKEIMTGAIGLEDLRQ